MSVEKRETLSLVVLNNPHVSSVIYDLNGICETADSTFWTLVPEEVFAIWNTPYSLGLVA